MYDKTIIEEKMTISEIAELLNISKSALRYYEKEKLITPLRFENSNYRKYSSLTLFEMTDIILYRNIGVPVKDINSLMYSPIENTTAAIDSTIDETYKQIKHLNQTLHMLSLYERKIQKYLSVRASNYRVVNHPNINQLSLYKIKDSEFLKKYLENPYDFPYGVYLKSAIDSQIFEDCIIELDNDDPSQCIWDYRNYQCKYLECLTRTEYGLTEHNNISEHVAYMQTQGFRPGFAVAEYLTFDYSLTDKKRYDYYLTWIQIL